MSTPDQRDPMTPIATVRVARSARVKRSKFGPPPYRVQLRDRGRPFVVFVSP